MNLNITSGLVLHLETDRGLAATADGTVTSWKDASSAGHDLTGSGDPAIGTVFTPSGAPTVSFDGTGDKLQRNLEAGLNLPTFNQDRTIFFVVDYRDPQGNIAGISFGGNQENRAFGLAADPGDGDLMVAGNGSGNIATDAEGVVGGFLVQSAVLSAGQLSQYLDGELVASEAHDFNTRLQRLMLGAEINGVQFAELDVGAVLVYDRALSEAERLEVESYLQDKYLVDDGMNNAPVAVSDAAVLNTGASLFLDIEILANDLDDTSFEDATINIVEGPQNGIIAGINPTTGTVTYLHDGGPSNADSFTYTVTDVSGATSAPATVDVEIDFFGWSLEGFTDETVITRDTMNATSSFFLPISMAFLPDNRMLLLSKDGEILIVDPESGASESFMKLNNIDTGQERGLLDITLDPDFETNGHFYLYYTPNTPENARIARFTFEENAGGLSSRGSPASATIIWEDTDGYLACCHYGGGLDFGPDGKIWLTSSDKFQATTPGEGASGGVDLPLDLTSSSGKIIRINPDGTVPDGSDGWAANPWADPNDGYDDYVWGYGLRNPFRARWDAEYGQMYIGEVGGNQQNSAHDDLHTTSLDQAGAFYGWPFYEGTPNTYVNNGLSPEDPANFPQPDGDIGNAAEGDFYSRPIWSLPHNGASASLTGGEVYRGDMFPEEWDGVYFYGDYTRDYIRYLILDETGTQVMGDYPFKPSAEIPGTTNEVVALTVGNDGALYYAMISSGEVRRVTWSEGTANAAPEILTAQVTPATGDLPLEVTFTATVTDPDGDPLNYSVNFGDGTIFSGAVNPDGTISVPHTYVTVGSYSVSLSISDAALTSFSSALAVQAGDPNDPPEISGIGSDFAAVDPGDTVTFTATATDPDAGDELTYVWRFGDGTTEAGTVPADGVVTATHAYATDGTYTAFLEVFDGTVTVQSQTVPIQVGEATEVPITQGLVLLLQSDIKIGLGNGNTVTAWLDGSGNGNNLFAKGDPQLEEGRTPTGQPAIVFDGVGDLLQRVNSNDTIFNLPSGNADRTMFLVVRYLDAEGVSSGLSYGDGAKNQSFGLVTNGADDDLTLQGWGGGNDFDSNVDGPASGWLVQSVVLDDSSFQQYLNGAVIGSDDHTFGTDVQKLILGGEIAGKGESQLEVAAALVYNRALTEPQRQQVEDFLQSKYITGSMPGNTAPVAEDDLFAADEDSAISGSVLADNGSGPDTDADGDALTVTLVSNVAQGVLALNPDGSFDYVPAADFFGTDSFVYRVNDGMSGTSEATVTLQIAPVDDPAVAADDSYATTAGVTLTVAAAGVLANDTDVEGDAITATLVQGVTAGDLTLNSDGSFSYTPDGGFLGQDSFTYSVPGDDVATVTITVSNPNDPPIANDDRFSLAEDTSISGDVLADNGDGVDSDPDGDPLTVTLVTAAARGALTLNSDGSFDYVPDADFFGADSFTYRLNDGKGGTAQATVSLSVRPVDDPALAADDTYDAVTESTLTIAAGQGVLANDVDPDGDALTATLETDVSNGTLTLSQNGSFSYTPDTGFTGQDSFTYSVPGGDLATVTIDVAPAAPQSIPVFGGLIAAYQSDENVSLSGGTTVAGWLDGSGRGNDLVAAGNPALISGATPTGQSAIAFDGTGDLLQRINATDTLSGFVGGNGDRTIFLVANYIDAEGVASGLVYGDGAKNQAFGLVSNSYDQDLTLQGWGKNRDFDSNVDGPTSGWLVQSVVLDDSTFRHYLNGGLIDSRSTAFATDVQRLVLGGEIAGLGESELDIAAALVYDRALTEPERQQVENYLQSKYISGSTPGNTAPVAEDDVFAGTEDAPISGDVLADNGSGADADPDGDPLFASLVTDVAHGTLTLNQNGSFDYIPDADFFGADSFVYRVSDGKGGTDEAIVSVQVNPVEDPAVAADDTYGGLVDETLTVAAGQGVLANDIDPDGDPLTATLETDVSNGTLTLNGDGSFSYTPDTGFTGQDSFTYSLSGDDVATVAIDISPAPSGIPVLNGLIAAYRSDENVSLGAGATVAGWLDGSGRGNDLVAAGDPTLISAATPTGQSAIAFDGTGDLLQRINATDTLSGFSGGSGDRTMFLVANYIDAEGITSGLVYGDGAKNQAFGLVTNGSDGDLMLQGWGKSQDVDSNVAGEGAGWLVQSVVLDRGSFEHYRNGDLIDSGSRNFNTDVQRLVLGGEIAGFGESELEIAAALVYDRALTDAEHQQVEEYLYTTYIDDDVFAIV